MTDHTDTFLCLTLPDTSKNNLNITTLQWNHPVLLHLAGEIAVDLVVRQAWATAIITNEITYTLTLDWGKMMTIISHISLPLY